MNAQTSTPTWRAAHRPAHLPARKSIKGAIDPVAAFRLPTGYRP
jgi:hypothetical protein